MPEKTLNKKSLIKRIFSDNAYSFLAMGCAAGIMLLVFYSYNLWPFGGKTILRMDLYHQYGPLFAELYDRLTSFKSLIYSWQTGLGGPFLGNFFNYLSTPGIIIMLLAGHINMPEAIAFMIMAKAMMAAFMFSYYLRKSRERNDFSISAFGILYAFSGYFVAYYWDVMWIDAMAIFPLVILGIEYIIDKRKPGLYIGSLAFLLLTSYYMGYMVCIMSVLYFLVYYFGKYEISSLSDRAVYYYNKNFRKRYKFSQKIKGNLFLRSGLLFAAASVTAACLVAFALIPTYVILQSCSATGADMPENSNFYFSIFDFLANHLGSVEPTIRSSGEDVLPNVYCGVGTLLLVPLYLFTRSVSVKEKVSRVTLLAVFFISFNLNKINFIWHGFHFPNDLPYRFSFMYSFVLLILAYDAFIRLREFSARQILGAGVCVLFAIIIIQEIGSKNCEDITIILSIIFTVSYCLIYYLMRSDKFQKGTVCVLVLCAAIGEIACCNTDRYTMNQTKDSFCGDYEDFRSLKDILDEREGNDNYRLELTYNRARMDPAWFGYNGISTFSSMAYEKMSNMQSNLGLSSNYINSYTYNLQTPVYNMMNSVKYIVDNDPQVTVERDYYTPIDTVNDFTAYENKYYLPIAMVVNKDINLLYSEFDNPFTVQSDWFEYSTGVDGVFSRVEISDIAYYNMDEITSGIETGDIYFNKTGSGDGELTFYLSTDELRHCYLYVDSSSFEEITITKNGESIVQTTDEPYIYDLGLIGPDDETSVLMSIEEDDYGSIKFFPYYINEDKLEQGYEILKAGGMQVESFEDTKVTGTIYADMDKTVFTSIPFDESWHVYVDGAEISEEEIFALCDAYLCFDISAGEHTIELVYRQKGLSLGFAISGAAAIILIIAVIFVKKRRPVWDRRLTEKQKKARDDYNEKYLLPVKYEIKMQIEKLRRERAEDTLPEELPADIDAFIDENNENQGEIQNTNENEVLE